MVGAAFLAAKSFKKGKLRERQKTEKEPPRKEEKGMSGNLTAKGKKKKNQGRF